MYFVWFMSCKNNYRNFLLQSLLIYNYIVIVLLIDKEHTIDVSSLCNRQDYQTRIYVVETIQRSTDI